MYGLETPNESKDQVLRLYSSWPWRYVSFYLLCLLRMSAKLITVHLLQLSFASPILEISQMQATSFTLVLMSQSGQSVKLALPL